MAEPGHGGRVLDRLEALARQGSAAPGDAVLDLMVDLLQARGPFMRPPTGTPARGSSPS
jgi:hypothetical protein